MCVHALTHLSFSAAASIPALSTALRSFQVYLFINLFIDLFFFSVPVVSTSFSSNSRGASAGRSATSMRADIYVHTYVTGVSTAGVVFVRVLAASCTTAAAGVSVTLGILRVCALKCKEKEKPTRPAPWACVRVHTCAPLLPHAFVSL